MNLCKPPLSPLATLASKATLQGWGVHVKVRSRIPVPSRPGVLQREPHPPSGTALWPAEFTISSYFFKQKIPLPWRRKWQPTAVFLPGESHGRRSLAGYSPWGHRESDTTERLTIFQPTVSTVCHFFLFAQLQPAGNNVTLNNRKVQIKGKDFSIIWTHLHPIK